MAVHVVMPLTRSPFRRIIKWEGLKWQSRSKRSIFQKPLARIRIVMPDSADEEAEIAAYLDEKCAAIDILIAKKTALLTELESYKKSLIYEYVTGKKEVDEELMRKQFLHHKRR